MVFTQTPSGPGPSAERIAMALRSPPAKAPPRAARGAFAWPWLRRQRSASEHLYFDVRLLAGAGGRSLLQYGFADDRGNIVLSVYGAAAAAIPGPAILPPEDLAVEPMDAEWLAELIGLVCRGASLVTFHRVLKAGLLPPGAAAAADSIECAWRRYLRLMRQRGQLDRTRPVTLDDALETSGAGAVGSPDAALRALGVRELWSWMDHIE